MIYSDDAIKIQNEINYEREVTIDTEDRDTLDHLEDVLSKIDNLGYSYDARRIMLNHGKDNDAFDHIRDEILAI